MEDSKENTEKVTEQPKIQKKSPKRPISKTVASVGNNPSEDNKTSPSLPSSQPPIATRKSPHRPPPKAKESKNQINQAPPSPAPPSPAPPSPHKPPPKSKDQINQAPSSPRRPPPKSPKARTVAKSEPPAVSGIAPRSPRKGVIGVSILPFGPSSTSSPSSSLPGHSSSHTPISNVDKQYFMKSIRDIYRQHLKLEKETTLLLHHQQHLRDVCEDMEKNLYRRFEFQKKKLYEYPPSRLHVDLIHVFLRCYINIFVQGMMSSGYKTKCAVIFSNCLRIYHKPSSNKISHTFDFAKLKVQEIQEENNSVMILSDDHQNVKIIVEKCYQLWKNYLYNRIAYNQYLAASLFHQKPLDYRLKDHLHSLIDTPQQSQKSDECFLSLSDRPLSMMSCQCLNIMLKSSPSLQIAKSIMHLNLIDVKLSSDHISLLQDGLYRCPSIISLDISKNRLDESICTLFFSLLREMPVLHVLTMNYCALSDRLCAILAGHISHYQSLRYLSLNHNLINDTAIEYLVNSWGSMFVRDKNLCDLPLEKIKSLPQPSTKLSLHSISLNSNDIGGTGALYLSYLFYFPTLHLHSLLLSKNHIGDNGIISLAQAMPFHQHLHNLDVSNNNSTQYGYRTLIQNMRITPSLYILAYGEKEDVTVFNQSSNVISRILQAYHSQNFNTIVVLPQLLKEEIADKQSESNTIEHVRRISVMSNQMKSDLETIKKIIIDETIEEEKDEEEKGEKDQENNIAENTPSPEEKEKDSDSVVGQEKESIVEPPEKEKSPSPSSSPSPQSEVCDNKTE